MEKCNLDFGVVSSHSRDDLYAELMCNNVQWGEIRLAPDRATTELVIHPRSGNKEWIFPFSDVIEVMHAARMRLLEVEGIKSDSPNS